MVVGLLTACRIRGIKAIDNKARLKEWHARLKNADVAVRQAWIEEMDGDFSHLKQYNISLDSAQASKLTLVPALLYRINVLEADLASDKSIKRSLIVSDSKAYFFAFKDSLNIAVINGVFENGKWKTEGYGTGVPSYKEKDALNKGKTLLFVAVYGGSAAKEGYPYREYIVSDDGKQLIRLNLYGSDRPLKDELLRWKSQILENMKNLKNKQ